MSGTRLKRHFKVKGYRTAMLFASPFLFMLRVSIFRRFSIPS
jgi:hypothetical protein